MSTSSPNLPFDVFAEIVEILDSDAQYEGMAAMCSTHSSLWPLYIKKRYKSVKFNLRRRDIIQRLGSLLPLLSSPHIYNAVRSISITDHCVTEDMTNNEAEMPFQDEGEQVLFSDSDMSTNLHGQRYLLLLADNICSRAFSTVLQRMKYLSSLTLSFGYHQIQFDTFTPLMRRAICNMVSLPTMKEIYFIGLAEVPFQLLGRFMSLKTLSLKACTFAAGSEESLSDIAQSRSRFNLPQLSQIENLTVQNIQPHDGARLLNYWNDTYPAMISNIQRLRILFRHHQDVNIARALMHYGKETVTHLEVHTLSLTLPHAPYRWSNPEMLIQPEDIRQLSRLEALEMSVADWNTDIQDLPPPTGNNEIQWALHMFKAANPATLRRVTLRIKVGGCNQVEDGLDALIDFERRLHDGLMDEWLTELREVKWVHLESFSIHLLFPSMESLDLSRIVGIAPAGSPETEIVQKYKYQVWSGVFNRLDPVFSDERATCEYKVFLSNITRAGLVTEKEPIKYEDYMDVDFPGQEHLTQLAVYHVNQYLLANHMGHLITHV